MGWWGCEIKKTVCQVKQKDQSATSTTDQSTNIGDLDYDESSRDGENRSDYGHILKIELT